MARARARLRADTAHGVQLVALELHCADDASLLHLGVQRELLGAHVGAHQVLLGNGVVLGGGAQGGLGGCLYFASLARCVVGGLHDRTQCIDDLLGVAGGGARRGTHGAAQQRTLGAGGADGLTAGAARLSRLGAGAVRGLGGAACGDGVARLAGAVGAVDLVRAQVARISILPDSVTLRCLQTLTQALAYPR